MENNTQSQILPIQNKLANNPTTGLKYAVSVTSKSGRKLQLSDPKMIRVLVSLMDMYAVIGGAASHYGGPAAFAEMMSAIHGITFAESNDKNKQWHELFHIINDAGHCENGLYALKANYNFAGLKLSDLKKFRSIESVLTGHGESHLFPEAVELSNGPLGSALPQAQGLAMADSQLGNKRVTITAISDGACMEGEAREALAAIPGFATQGKLAPFILVISDNNTKLSGRIDKDSFSMEPTFQSLKTLGWNVLSLENGNDLQACVDCLEEALRLVTTNPKSPVAIHMRTVKGIGTKKTAESASGGHGFPLKSPKELPEFLNEILAGQELPAEFNSWVDELIQIESAAKAKAAADEAKNGKSLDEKIQTGISNAMIKARKKFLPVISITADLPGSTGVAGFRKEFPADSIDVGIAESNMISVAAGYSKAGYIPVVDTFAQFGVTKGALPLTMASLSEAPMIGIFSHTGFQDAADGASHQGLTYLAMLSSIPHVDTYCLSCSEEADEILTQIMDAFVRDRKSGKVPRTSILFLGRENFPKNYGVTGFDKNRIQILKNNLAKRNVALVTTGSCVPETLKAFQKLEALGFGGAVVNVPLVNHPDVIGLKSVIESCQGRVAFVEDHQIIGGAGYLLAGALLKAKVKLDKVHFFGVKEEFGQSAYNAIELYKKHHLDADSIVDICTKEF